MEGDFEGEMKDGVRDGKGVLQWTNGDKYEGEFKNGFREGQGVLAFQVKGKEPFWGYKYLYYTMQIRTHAHTQHT
jgi:hypothetical protein